MSGKENKLPSKSSKELNNEDKKPIMILTIEIGNNSYDKLMIYTLETREQETYNFCLKNKQYNKIKYSNIFKNKSKLHSKTKHKKNSTIHIK